MKKLAKFLTGRLFFTAFVFLLDCAFWVLVIYLIMRYAVSPDFLGELLLIIICLSFGLSWLIMFYIVSSKIHDSYKISWLVVTGGIPILGPVLFLLFANKKFTKKERRMERAIRAVLDTLPPKAEVIDKVGRENEEALLMSNYIYRETGSPLVDDSYVKYFPFGEIAFPYMLKELKKAKHYIFLEYFIIEKGIMWDAILDILKAKAKEGLDVRVLYDDVGSVSTLPSKYYRELRKFGIRAYAVNPLNLRMSIRLNNRDHRKIMVIDGHTGFTGGINLADEYINKKERFGVWKDNAIMIKGEAVYGLTRLFLATWLSIEKPNRPTIFDYYLPSVHIDECDDFDKKGYVQCYGDIPFNYEAVGENIYLHLIERAKKYVFISTPYLIIDAQMMSALVSAAKQGIDVRILMPGIPDKKLVYTLAHAYYQPLLKGGVKIYEYTPGFVHMKMFVVDDIYATCGTVNLDFRSLFLHSENGTFLYKTPCIMDMKQDFIDSFNLSRKISYDEYRNPKLRKRITWGILKMFAPLL